MYFYVMIRYWVSDTMGLCFFELVNYVKIRLLATIFAERKHGDMTGDND